MTLIPDRDGGFLMPEFLRQIQISFLIRRPSMIGKPERHWVIDRQDREAIEGVELHRLRIELSVVFTIILVEGASRCSSPTSE